MEINEINTVLSHVLLNSLEFQEDTLCSCNE